MTRNRKDSRFTKYKPLIAIILFVSIAGISASLVLSAFKVLASGFDLLWVVGLLVFGFLLILSFVVLLSMVYILDHSRGKVKNRIRFIEGFFGGEHER
ncbi:MAG: hypothetical protein ACE5IO_07720 [Thermoplasmata archaeon]